MRFKDSVLAALERIEAAVSQLKEKVMGLATDMTNLIKAVDDATNTVAARIDRLSSRITNSMSDAEVADIKAQLAAESTRLTTLGQDPQNPVPVPPSP